MRKTHNRSLTKQEFNPEMEQFVEFDPAFFGEPFDATEMPIEMMGATLHSIETRLGHIEEMTGDILRLQRAERLMRLAESFGFDLGRSGDD